MAKQTNKHYKEETKFIEELNTISTVLKVARSYDLEAEVVRSALQHAMKHPELSSTVHMAVGLSEWVK